MSLKKANSRIITALALVIILVLSLFGCGGKNTKTDKDNDMGIRYISFGSGERTMVIVPGLSITYVTDNKEAVEQAFSSFTDDYTIYLFDIKEDVPDDYSIPQMGEDLVAKINELGLKDIYLYGCSMGGMESIYIAGTYPELVEKLVVASSACKANEISKTVIGNWINLAEEGNKAELTNSMGELIYSPAVYEANKEAFSQMADSITDEMLTRFINTAKAVNDVDITKEAKSIECPVLVLGALGDKVLTSDASENIAELTNGMLYLYGEEYPHAVYDEASDFRSRVKAFFK